MGFYLSIAFFLAFFTHILRYVLADLLFELLERRKPEIYKELIDAFIYGFNSRVGITTINRFLFHHKYQDLDDFWVSFLRQVMRLVVVIHYLSFLALGGGMFYAVVTF